MKILNKNKYNKMIHTSNRTCGKTLNILWPKKLNYYRVYICDEDANP